MKAIIEVIIYLVTVLCVKNIISKESAEDMIKSMQAEYKKQSEKEDES